MQKKEHSAGVVVFVTHTLSTSALCYKVLVMEVCTTKIETATRETNAETKLCSHTAFGAPSFLRLDDALSRYKYREYTHTRT